MPDANIQVWGDAPEGQIKVEVHSERMNCDHAMFTFTDEGVVIDMVKGDEIVGTTSQMWEEVEEVIYRIAERRAKQLGVPLPPPSKPMDIRKREDDCLDNVLPLLKPKPGGCPLKEEG